MVFLHWRTPKMLTHEWLAEHLSPYIFWLNYDLGQKYYAPKSSIQMGFKQMTS